MADPVRLKDILNGGKAGLHPSVAYIFKKQLVEGDIILISKTDLLTAEELTLLKKKTKISYPNTAIKSISVATVDGMGNWLNEVLSRSDTGNNLVEVNYDVYAEYEAVMGLLNSTFELNGSSVDWDVL